MSLLGNIGHWFRNEADNVGSLITGQPAHSAPTPQPQAQAPPAQQAPAFHPSTPAGQLMLQRIGSLDSAFHPAGQPQQSNPKNPFRTQPQTPTPPPPHPNLLNRDFSNAASHLVGGIVSPATNLAGLAGNEAKTVAADITHNQIARQNAITAGNQNVQNEADIARGLITKPAAELVTSLDPSIHTAYHPGPGIQQGLFGKAPIQNIETKVAHNFDTHSNLPWFERGPLAVGEAVGSLAQDLPVASTALKLGKEATTATKAIGTNEIGAVGKNVNEPPVNKPNVPEVYKHFTDPEIAKQLQSGVPFDYTKNPIHGTGNLAAGETTGKLVNDGKPALYLSKDDKTWSVANIPKANPEVVNIDHVTPQMMQEGYLQKNGITPQYDHTAQKWVGYKNAFDQKQLAGVDYHISPDARKLTIDSPAKLKQVADSIGTQPDDPNFWAALRKNYDVLDINNVAKNRGIEGYGRKFFKAARADQSIVLNPEVASTKPLATKPVTPPTQGVKGFIEQESKPLPDGSKIVIKNIKNPDGPGRVRIQQRVDKNTDQPFVSNQTEVKPIKLNNADLDRRAQNILKNGGTTDEAVNVYYEQGIPLGDAIRNVSRVAKQSKLSLGEDLAKNPYYNKIKLPEATTDEQAILNRQAVQKNIADRVNQVELAAKGLSENDVSLLDRLRNEKVDTLAKEADNPKRFKEVAAKAKDLTDYQQELGRMHGQAVAYRPNYGARLSFDVSTPERQQAVEAYKAMLRNNPGYGKRRAYNSYEEANKASNGLLVRRNKNFLEDLRNDAQARANDIGQLTLQQSLERVHPGQVKVGEIGSDLSGTYNQLKIAGGKKLSLPEDVADTLNDRAAYQYRRDAGGKLLKVYDQTINAPLKFFKLAGGGFHDLNTYLGFTAHQILSGTTKGLVRALTVQVSPKRFEAAMNEFRNDTKLTGSNASTVEWANATGLTHGTHEISADVGGPVIEHIPLIKQMHDAMFQREIPYMKLKTLQNYVEGRDITNPTDVEYVRRASRATNYAQGGLNRAVEGFTATSAKLWSRALLALDFNEGQVRSLINAAIKGGPDGVIARKTIGGRMALLAIPGITAWAVAHPNERSHPEDWLKNIADQLIDPHLPSNFKTPGGIPKNIKLITNDAGKAFRVVAPALDKNNPDKTSGLKSEASANSAAGLSELLQLKNNKDYYGNPIIVKGKNGKVNIKKTAEQVGVAAGPIPVGQIQRVVDKKQTAAEAGLNILGVGHTAANPEDPRMKVLNSRQKIYDGQSQDTKAAIDLVHPSWNQNLTQDQKNAIYSNPAYESNKWNVLAHNPEAVTALRKQDAEAQRNGQPGDPLFKLSPQDFKTITTYEWLKNADPGTDANNSAAVMYNKHKDLIDNYAQASQNYGQQMQQLYQQTGGLKGDTGQSNNVDIGGVPHFTVTPQTQDTVNQYFNIANSKQRVDFMAQHPEVQQYIDAQFQHQNDRRAALGEPLLKPYPKASSDIQQILDTYNALPKSKSAGNTDPSTSGMRSAWIKAHPDEYEKMREYYARVDAYNLSKQAGQVQFEGQDYNQKSLKAIQSLGQYDILKNPDGSLALLGTGGVQPGAVGTGSSSFGGGYKKLYTKKTKAPFSPLKKYRKINIKHSKKHKIYLKKPASPVKIHNKTKPIGIKSKTYQ